MTTTPTPQDSGHVRRRALIPGGGERGSGLRGLTDRIEALQGTLRIESPTGHGTRITAELPVGAATPAAA